MRLELDADVPEMLLATPGFEGTIETILDGSIARLEGSIYERLLADYAVWADAAALQKADEVVA